MNYWRITALLTGIFLGMLTVCMIWGCQSAAFQEGDYTGQGLQADFKAPATPGAVIATHQDGSMTVAPLPTSQSAPAQVTAPNLSPVVSMEVIPAQPGVVESYVITPEVQKGDSIVHTRIMTWAGEAPGTVVEKVATQKVKLDHKALPAVNLDRTGIHTTAGGGSTEDQAGQSLWQRFSVWFWDTVKGWTMWLLVLGIGIVAFIVLPIFFPFLKPIFASLTDGIHRMWDWATGEVGRLMAWLKTVHLTKSASTSIPTATLPTAASGGSSAVPTSLAPSTATPAPPPVPAPVAVIPTAPPVVPPVAPVAAIPPAPAVPPAAAVSTAATTVQAEAQALAAQAAAFAQKVANG